MAPQLGENERDHLLTHPFESEFRLDPESPLLAQRSAKLRVKSTRHNSLSQLICVLHAGEQWRACWSYGFTYPGVVRTDDCQTRRHRLENAVGDAFRMRAEHAEIGSTKDTRDIPNLPQEVNVRGEAEVSHLLSQRFVTVTPPASKEQVGLFSLHPKPIYHQSPSRDERGVVFVRMQAGHHTGHERTFGNG
jgi:hypothetical protein